MFRHIIHAIGLSLFLATGGSAQPLPPVNPANIDKVYTLLSRGNDLWIGTLAGLVKFDKTRETWTTFTTENSGIPDDRILSLAFDSTGRLWIGTQYHAVAMYDGASFTPLSSNKTGVYFDQYVTQITFDSVGSPWLCAERYLLIFKDSSWQSYYTAHRGIGFSVTNKFVFDKTGIPWLGTDWGLGKFVGDTVLTKYDGFVNHINSIAVDKNNSLWISEHGLVKYDGVSKTYYNTENTPLPSNAMPDLKFDSKGNLWFPCGDSLVKYDGLTWKFFPCDSGFRQAFKLEIDDRDVIWVGTLGNGLYRFDGTNWNHYRFLVTSVPKQHFENSMDGFFLLANYPNPFNSSTTIRYHIPQRAKVSLQIVNSLGQLVAQLIEGEQAAGHYQATWNSTLPSGFYLCRLEAGGHVLTRKMLLLK